jgi:hypothetical protein
VRRRPQLAELSLADAPERWRALGFAIEEPGVVVIGGVTLRLGVPGHGITGWALRGVDPALTSVDGLPTAASAEPPPPQARAHPNGAIAIDHVVVITPRFDRTAEALEDAGLGITRTRDAGGFRQGFRRLGPAILELVESPKAPATAFWGLVVTVADLDALAARLTDRLKPAKPAVQPGRRIATLRQSAGLGQPMAFMDPEPGQ